MLIITYSHLEVRILSPFLLQTPSASSYFFRTSATSFSGLLCDRVAYAHVSPPTQLWTIRGQRPCLFCLNVWVSSSLGNVSCYTSVGRGLRDHLVQSLVFICKDTKRESFASSHRAEWLGCVLGPCAAGYQLHHLSPKPFILKMGVMMSTCLLTKQVPWE